MIYRDLSDVILISHIKNKGGITLASIVQRGGSYSVVYYTKENGIRKQKWESFRTEKDALHRKYMVEQYQQVKKELAHRPQTVGQLIREYVWLYGRAKWSLSMYTSTQGLIRNYIDPYFGSVRLDELTPRLVSKLYMEFQNGPRYCGPYHKYEGQSVSASTLKSVHKLLHSAFEQAVLWEYVGRNPFHKAVLPKTKATSSVFLSPEQIQLLLHHCSVSWLRLAIELSFVCTLRRGELLALTWDNINWEQNSLQISKTLCRVSKDAMLMLESLKSATRNFEKLLDILEFLLTHDLKFASTNFYIENGHVERRIKPLRAGHTSKETQKNLSQTAGLGYRHAAALNQL